MASAAAVVVEVAGILHIDELIAVIIAVNASNRRDLDLRLQNCRVGPRITIGGELRRRYKRPRSICPSNEGAASRRSNSHLIM